MKKRIAWILALAMIISLLGTALNAYAEPAPEGESAVAEGESEDSESAEDAAAEAAPAEGESAEGESDGESAAEAAPADEAAPAEGGNEVELDINHPIAGDIHVIETYEVGADGEVTVTSMVDPELGQDILFVTADDTVASVAATIAEMIK